MSIPIIAIFLIRISASSNPGWAGCERVHAYTYMLIEFTDPDS